MERQLNQVHEIIGNKEDLLCVVHEGKVGNIEKSKESN